MTWKTERKERRGGERSRERLPGVLAKCGATKNGGKKYTSGKISIKNKKKQKNNTIPKKSELEFEFGASKVLHGCTAVKVEYDTHSTTKTEVTSLQPETLAATMAMASEL